MPIKKAGYRNLAMVQCNEFDQYFGHCLSLGQWYVNCVSWKRWVPWENVRIFSRTLLYSESKVKACVYTVYRTQYDLVRKPSTLDALIGYFTPSHVIHQRLLLVFKPS